MEHKWQRVDDYSEWCHLCGSVKSDSWNEIHYWAVGQEKEVTMKKDNWVDPPCGGGTYRLKRRRS